MELDYSLLSDEGFEKMKEIAGDLTLDDNDIRALPFHVGCTACVCLITPDSIFCANAGDSRAILGFKNGKVI